jgi:hypothetical protein
MDVVSNFDFTFCEVWFDGKEVNGTYLDDALAGRGILRKEYVRAMTIERNRFTLTRMEKYIRRGYIIAIEPGYVFEVQSRRSGFDANHFISSTFLTYLIGLYPHIFRDHSDLITLDFKKIFLYLTHIGYLHRVDNFATLILNAGLGFLLKKLGPSCHCSLLASNRLINELLLEIPEEKAERIRMRNRWLFEDIERDKNKQSIVDLLQRFGVMYKAEQPKYEIMDAVLRVLEHPEDKDDDEGYEIVEEIFPLPEPVQPPVIPQVPVQANLPVNRLNGPNNTQLMGTI